MQADLRLLASFVAVAEERHFGRAADRLGISQPPLSQQIRKLETQLGIELIDRSSRPVGLTAAGAALLAEARLALSHADRAMTAAQRAAKGYVGELRLGAMQAAINSVVPLVLRAYHSRFPDVSLRMTEAGSADQIVSLVDGRLDVGFVRGPIDEPAVDGEQILDDPLVAVLPTDHWLAARDHVALADFVDEPFVLPARAYAPTTHADIVALFRHYDAEPQVIHEITTIPTLLALVASGVGVSLLPASFANLGRTGVAFRTVEGPLPHRPLTVVWCVENPSPSTLALVAVARDVARAPADAATPGGRIGESSSWLV